MSLRLLVIPAGILLGLVAETGWPRGVDTRLVVADLAIGWLFIGAGFAVWQSRPANRMGRLLIATGVTWFLATLISSAVFLYCGPLIHLLIAHPTGRVTGRTGRIVVGAGYAASALATVMPIPSVGLVFGVVIVAVGIVRLFETDRHGGRWTMVTYAVAGIVGLFLVGASVARLGGTSAGDAGLLAYQAALAVTVVCIVMDVLWWSSSPGSLASFVVDLGDAAEAGTLRDRLARAVGDPSLTLGYAVERDANAWVDDTGGAVRRPRASADRAVTPIAVGGVELGFVGHDPALVGDPRVFGLIAAAAGLAISNSATQAEIRRRIAAVDASRERLVHAADAQSRRIESELEDRVDARLGRAAELLTLAAAVRPEDSRLAEIRQELANAREVLRDFSRGVYPAVLRSSGLVAAIDDLVARSPVPVQATSAASARYDPAVESTLYFVCSESLANVVKHARATHATIQLTENEAGSVLRVADDGIGGANVAAGSGLRGLADRVEALGGSLVVSERAGGGTLLTAQVPRRPALRSTAPSVG